MKVLWKFAILGIAPSFFACATIAPSPEGADRGVAAETSSQRQAPGRYTTFEIQGQKRSETQRIRMVPGENYLDELKVLISQAKKSIEIQEFNFFAETGDVKEIADLLIAAKKSTPSLKIRVVLEGRVGANSPDGVAAKNGEVAKRLKRAGAEVALVSGVTAGSADGITHAKVVCVDRKWVLAGSTNFTNTSIGRNNEMNIWIESPALAQAYGTYLGLVVQKSDELHSGAFASGAVEFIADQEYLPRLLSVIRAARRNERLSLAMYYFGYSTEEATEAKSIFNELVAAHSRGVKITLLLEQNAGALAVAPGVTLYNFRVAEKLRKAGISEIYFDAPGRISHHKYAALGDRIAILGSSNWSTGDLRESHQVNWRVIHSPFVRELHQYLANKVQNEAIAYSKIPRAEIDKMTAGKFSDPE